MTDTTPQLHHDLPDPTQTRWQPLRLGLVELFHYDTEEFWFRDGHLLLRGNNGTGKSKVLALTLPFLLDGDTSAHRVEPDGDPKKRMDWNLLMGGRHDERTGYSWIEFGRRDNTGAPRFTTLLCGMKAAAGRGVTTWFAITDQRMGRDLHLVDRAGIVLGKDRLRETLGDRGVLVDRAQDYRRLVNERLFGLSTERYEAMLTLLVQLRQPQLSKRPDMAALDRALTEALPPLPAAVVADVAEAMRTLERQRQDVEDLQQARAAVGRFDRDYRRYATIATLRRADDVRSRTVTYEQTGRDLGEAERVRDDAAAAVEELEAAERGFRDTVERLRVREQTLRESPEMRQAAQLDAARRRAEETSAAARTAAGHAEAAAEELGRRQDRLAEADRQLQETTALVERLRGDLAEVAEVVGLGPHRPDGRALAGSVATAPGDRATADRVVTRRREALEHVRHLTGRAADAAAAHRRALAELERAVEAHDEAASQLVTAEEQLAQAQAAWLTAIGQAAADWQALAATGLEEALDAAELWARTLSGEDPFGRFAGRAHLAVAEEVAARRAGVEGTRADVARDRAQVEQHLHQLIEGVPPRPEPLPTRPAEDRQDRAGAPLWQLVDFADGVGEDDRAGVEAALEGAGLLDAWVAPDGDVLSPDTTDVAITRSQPPVERSVTSVLIPAGVGPDGAAPAVADDVVADLLARIGLGPATGGTWIATDGRFRIGVAEGAWHKPRAQFVGWAAQEAHRAEQIEQARGRLADLDDQDRQLAGQLAQLDTRRAQADQDLAAVPPPTDVVDGHGEVALRTSRAADAAVLVGRRDEASAQARGAADVATAARDEAAAELDLPITTDGQDDVGRALEDLRSVLAELWGRLASAARAQASVDQAQADVSVAEGVLQARRDEAEEAATRRDNAVVTHMTLQETVGESVEAVLAALAETEQQRTGADAQAVTHRELAAEARTRRDEASGRVKELSRQHADQRILRAAAVDALRRLAATGLVEAALDAAAGRTPADRVPDADDDDAGVIVPDLTTEWAADPGVRLARDLRQALPDIDAGDTAWDRSASTVTGSLGDLERTMAAQGARTWHETTEGVAVVGVHIGGQDIAVHRLGALLDDRLADRRRLLDAREQQILEEHLVTEIAAQLSALIAEADQMVARMNTELTDRPTSTGMVLRLRRRLDTDAGPAGLEQALARLLRQTSGAWNTEDRQALGQFLQAEIQRCRVADEGGTWVEHLTRAFDYRRWHRFVVEVRKDGTWRSADGPASGGERVLAVTVPLFAAASSHYSSAGSAAPRLVLLDEAFAGVDDAARRQCLGLLATFDLDYVLTSEREWGCYPEVPGLSICHLVRRGDIDAVHVSRWEWDGSRRHGRDRPADTVREHVGAGHSTGGLLDD